MTPRSDLSGAAVRPRPRPGRTLPQRSADAGVRRWGAKVALLVCFVLSQAAWAQNTEPPKPTGVTVSGGDASVTLGWTSGGNGGSAITKWQYLKEEGGTWDGTWTDICETSTNSNCPSVASHTVSDLTNGTAYKFKVRAVNAVGDGAESDESASVTPAGKRPKPTGVTVSGGNASVTLGWTSGGNGGAEITKWQYLKKDGDDWDSTWTDICETSSDSNCPSKTSHSVSSLNNGTAYKFKVRAVNTHGDGAESDESASVTPAGKPPKPTGVTVSGGNASVTLGWTSGGNGGAEITKWQYLKKDGDDWDSTWTDICVTSSDSNCPSKTSHSVSSLNNGTAYKFKVRAVNAVGEGAESDESAAVTPATKPPKPTGVTVSGGDASVTLGWTSGGNGGSAITKWQYLKEDGGTWDGTWTDICETASDSNCPSTTSHTVSDLTNGTAYKFKVRAVNAVGEGAESDESASVTPATKPPKPTGVTVSGGDASVTLGWTSGGNGGSAITKWQYLKEEGGTWDGTWTDICETSTNSNCPSVASHTVSSLTNGTAYKFKLRAVNAVGDGAESDESASVTPEGKPFKPTNVTVTRGDQSVTLGWTSGGDGGSAITKWQYRKQTDSTWDSSWTDICVTSSNSNCPSVVSHTVSSLNNGTAYKFKVRAVNTHGDGAESDESAAVKPAGQPPKPTKPTVAAGHKNVKVSSFVSHNNGSAITKWQYKKKTSNTWDSNWTEVANSAQTETMTVTVVGLVNGTTYRFKVQAVNDVGASDESDESDAATPKIYTFEVRDRTETTATLHLTGYPGPWYYKGSGTCTLVPSGTTTVALENLTAGTSYTYTAHNTTNANCTSDTQLGSALTFSTLDFRLSTKTDTTANLELDHWSQGDPWSYRKEHPGVGSCTNTTTTSVSLTGLEENTSYTYRAYRGSGCATGKRIGIVYLKTTPAHGLFANTVGATTAKLSLNTAGADIAWSHQKTAGPGDASCADVAAGTNTVDLSGLTAGQSYTWAAYRDGGCAETKKIDDVRFATRKPLKPAKPTATPGNARVTLTSSVQTNGGPAITKWQYIKREGENAWETSWQDISDSADTTLSATITGLTNNTEYRFKVRAVNSVDESDASDESDAVTPKAPTLTASKVEDDTATLTIAHHSGNWHYKYTSPNGGQCSSNAVSGKTVDLTELSTATSYTFKAYGNSTCSTELATASAFLTKPGQVSGVTLTAYSTQIDVSWTAHTGTVTGYKVQWKSSSDSDYNTGDRQKTVTGTSTSITGLTNATEYTVRVTAYNNTGDGTPSAESKATPTAATLTASDVEDDTATLTIASHSGNWYYKYTSPSNGSCSSDAVSGTTVDLSDLSTATSYTFKAYGDSGCETVVATASAFLTKPGQVSGVTLTAYSQKIDVSWTAQTGTLTGYKVQWKSSSDSDYNTGDRQQEVTGTSTSITGLTNATEYTVRVTAYNTTGDGTPSTESKATPSAVTLTATKVEDDTATLTINNHSGNWHYQYTSPNGGQCSSTAVSGTTVDLSDLATATSYTFKAYGNSTCSMELAAASAFLTKPGQVSGVALTAYSTRIDVSWTAQTGTLTGYKVQWKSSSDTDYNTGDRQNEVTGTTASITGLTNATEYTVRVTAYNGTGDGTPSAESKATPAAVSLSVSDVEHDTATLTITNHADAWWYKGSQSGATCTKVAAGTKTASLTSLATATSHTYKAYSNDDCSTLVATASAFVTKPGQVSGVTLTAYSKQIDVSWTAHAGTVSGYKVQWKSSTDSDYNTGNRQKDVTPGTATSTSITGLTNAKEYTVRVTAYNNTGDGDPSAESKATPAVATLTASDVEDDTATLTINNHAGAWWYKGSQSGATCTKVAAGTTTADLADLATATSHTYKAYSNDNCSTLVATASAFLTKPGQVSGVTVTGLHKSLSISWTAQTGTLNGYKVQWKSSTDDDYNTGNRLKPVNSGTTASVTNLTNAAEYTVRVTAYNDTGDGDPSADSKATPTAATLTPGTATATGMTLTIDRWPGAWYYKYTTPDGGNCSSTAVPAGTYSKAVASLKSNTAYIFKAYSNNTCGTELATAASHTTKPPKPATPTLTVGMGDGTVQLASSVTGTASLTEWQYKKQRDGGSYDADWTDIDSTSTSLSHTVTGLADGSSYKFKVRARNASGFGEVSNESAAATPKAVTLSAGSATATGMTLTISDYSLAWYYKYTTPDGGSCSATAVSAGTSSKALTGLDSNTAYVFKAYGDSGCETELAAAASYTTKPPKPAKPTLSNDGSRKLRVSSSVTGTASLTKWQYKKKQGGNAWDANWTDITSTSTSLSHTVGQLTNDASYQFKVRARNASGFGAESDPSAAGTPRDESLATSAVTATGLTLTINNHSGAWYYKHTTPSNGSCVSVADGTSSKAVTGLDSNTDYIFKAYSNNSCSTELAAGASVPTLPPQAAKPTLTVNLGSGRVRVSSSVTGTAALTKWQYKKKKDGGSYDANWSDIGSTSKTLAHTLGGLTDGSAYEFKVRARNGSGFGEESNASDAATPRAPTLTPSAVEAKSVTLTIANYSPNWRYKYTSPSGGQCSSAVSGTTASPTDLSSGTSYTFKAYGDNSCSTPLATASSFLTKPGKVTGVRAAGTHRSISLNWSAARGAAGYEVQWKSGGDNWDTTRQATSTTASALLTNLTSGIEYTVRVMATNATGDGEWSDEATATPANALLEVRNITANSATLAISNYATAWWYQGDQQGAACTAVAKGTNTASLTGLTPVTSYTYTAYGASDCASQTLAAVNFTTTEETDDFDETGDSDGAAPLAPSRPTVAPGDASVTLGWTSGGDGGSPITGWEYQEHEGANGWGPWTAIPGSGADTTRHTVTGLVNGTAYRFRVRAVNEVGEGEASPESEAVVPQASNGVPAFADGTVEDQAYRQNSPIEPLVLPAATGGDGALTYALTPEPPDGLLLDAATRTLSGTPTAALSATTFTWTATDADGDAAALTFTITVAAELTFGDAAVADRSYIQDSAIEALVLPAAIGGSGTLTYTLAPEPPAGLVLDPATITLSGMPTAALPATTFTWTATDIDGDAATLSFTIVVEADLMPSFGDARISDQSYPQGLAIEPLTLPLATGGNGDLTHALTPEPPAGLHFDPATRTLSGTPTGAHPASTYAWTATDADGDATELLFTIAVPADLAPSFGGVRVADLRLTNNRAMTPVALPAATGGDGRLTYALSPELPDGLRFDPLTRTLAGTPREILAPRAYEYTATDADPSEPDVASLTFTIEVAVSEARHAPC